MPYDWSLNDRPVGAITNWLPQEIGRRERETQEVLDLPGPAVLGNLMRGDAVQIRGTRVSLSASQGGWEAE